jgi:hypothetical protein
MRDQISVVLQHVSLYSNARTRRPHQPAPKDSENRKARRVSRSQAVPHGASVRCAAPTTLLADSERRGCPSTGTCQRMSADVGLNSRSQTKYLLFQMPASMGSSSRIIPGPKVS